MDVAQGSFIVEGAEEDVGPHYGGDDGSDTVEGLRQVDTHFRVAGRAADGDEGVRRRLEGAEAITDDKDAHAEAGEGPA